MEAHERRACMPEPDMFKIEVSHIGDISDAYFDDRISIEFSPSDVSAVRRIFRELALRETDNFNRQGWYREIHDRFYDAELVYRAARDKKDKP